jgi:hypothetical protein
MNLKITNIALKQISINAYGYPSFPKLSLERASLYQGQLPSGDQA